MSDETIMDKWKCWHCDEESEEERGRLPLFCSNPVCGKTKCFTALTGPFIFFDTGRTLSFKPGRLGEFIKKDKIFLTTRDNEEMFQYIDVDGYFNGNGEKTIRETTRKMLTVELCKTQYVQETESHIRQTTYSEREEFNKDVHLFALNNGNLNTETREITEHTPYAKITMKIPLTYQPNAKCPTMGKRLLEWLTPVNVIRIVEFAGSCLIHDYPVRKALIAHGEGANGKTCLVTYFKHWLGKDNISAVPVQDFDKRRFASALIIGKLANICDDMPSADWWATGKFKELTGSSPLMVEKKFKDATVETSTASMFFACNQLPNVTDETRAFWDRIQIIDFNRRFPNTGTAEAFIKDLLTDEEKSGFLNAALLGLELLQRDGDYLLPDDLDKRRTDYFKKSDPVAGFVHSRVEDAPSGDPIPKDVLYSEFIKYCLKRDVSSCINTVFAKKIKQVCPNISAGQRTYDDGRKHVWYGVRLIDVETEVKEEEPDKSPHELSLNDSLITEIFKTLGISTQATQGTQGQVPLNLMCESISYSILRWLFPCATRVTRAESDKDAAQAHGDDDQRYFEPVGPDGFA